MKRLFRNENALEFFFEDDVTIDEVMVWVASRIQELDPNEAHSCKVEVIDDMIIVSGDEDSMELELRDVEPINLWD